MTKILRYLKPHILALFFAVALICCTVVCDLSLPTLMSDIVSVGIQQGGIEDAAPDAVSAKGYRLMTTLNRSARDAMVRYRVHACTDVTGFGLLGHSFEMAQGSDVELELNVDAIDLIPEALEFANMGLLPAGMYRNRSFAEPGVDTGMIELCKQDLLYDPQTAGGLLMAVDPADAEALYRELQGCVPSAQRIGTVREYRGGKRIFLR